MKKREHLLPEKAKRKSPTAEKLTPEEALTRLDGLVAELEGAWKRDRLEWALDFLVLVRGFSKEAHKDKPDAEQQTIVRDAIKEFIASLKFLKGVEFVLEWADVIMSENRE
ncbi:MAG TPA: hypothetical protein VHI52_01465 [Verrucomicrobiae bacterium]|nr:hypothetical protein [Verrucomicrobiae bacterium]